MGVSNAESLELSNSSVIARLAYNELSVHVRTVG